MRDAKLPFRVGHHVASEIVEYARAHDIKPLDFPYDQAQRIYAETVVGIDGVPKTLPLTEAQFRATLDPVAIVKNRRTSGGPQPAEMARIALALARLRGCTPAELAAQTRANAVAVMPRLASL